MSDDQTSRPPTQDEFIRIGLTDPFIRVIIGMVAVALAVSIAVSLLGKGLSAALALGLALMFGVVLVVLRGLLHYVDSGFVKGLCLFASAVIVLAFLTLTLLLIPAVTFCWPQPYHDTLGLPACGLIQSPARPFKAVAYGGMGITMDPANNAIRVRVNYRETRQSDAEHIIGALRQGGYLADAVATNLNEVLTDDHSAGITLIKTSQTGRPHVGDIQRIVNLAVPVRDRGIDLFPSDTRFQVGDIQIDLF